VNEDNGRAILAGMSVSGANPACIDGLVIYRSRNTGHVFPCPAASKQVTFFLTIPFAMKGQYGWKIKMTWLSANGIS
jgi:hypothetical protein